MIKPVSVREPRSHYHWGEGGEAWVLLDAQNLSVKQESMAVGSSETLHYHQWATQFFYILSGSATFEVEAEVVVVEAGQGLTITPGQKHRVLNPGPELLVFLVHSAPSTDQDRINCI